MGIFKKAVSILTTSALLFLCSLSAAQADPPAAESNQRAQRAAKAFAESVAHVGTTEYATAYREAFTLATQRIEKASRRKSGLRRSQRGSIESDPRYLENLEWMLRQGGAKIWGGQDVPAGDFPATVAVLGSGGICTGTLIAPDVVLTAQHCGCGGVHDRVVFGDSLGNPLMEVRVDRHVEWVACSSDLKAGDLALLFLADEVDITPQKLAPTEWIDNAQEAWAVGFGRTEDPTNRPTGIKRIVQVPVASAGCDGSVRSPEAEVADEVYYDCRRGGELVAGAPLLDRDSCNGDSGGPLFIKGPDGGLFLAAATSRAVVRSGNRPCGDGGIYVRVDRAAAEWMRSQGVDLTVASTAPEGGSNSGASTAIQPENCVEQLAPVVDSSDIDEFFKAKKDMSKIVGQFRITGGESYFLPGDSSSVALPVSNLDAVPSALASLPVSARVARRDGKVEVDRLRLQYTDKWNGLVKDLPQDQFPDLHARFEALSRVERVLIEVPDAEEALEELNEQTLNSERDIVQAYAQLVRRRQGAPVAERMGLEDDLAHLSELYREAKTLSKAIYGSDDRYPPSTYEKIFQRSRGSVGIFALGASRPFCSGVLIARNVVLTCLHCTERAANQIEVGFGLTEDVPRTEAQFFRIRRYLVPAQTTSAPLDYQLLELMPDDDGKFPPDSGWPIQCLQERRKAVLNDPLYVVGHPAGERLTVHDNAFVYFPFEVSEFEFAELELTVQNELARASDREARLEEFRSSYERKTLPGSGVVYQHFSEIYGQPTIGVDADTFHGNSGSAVHHKRQHRVLGLLYAGKPDLQTPWDPGWRNHEAILPITEVIRNLDKALPGWRTLPDLCLED